MAKMSKDDLPGTSAAIEDDKASNGRSSATHHAYVELRRLIHSGDLKAGRTFLQQALAEMLNVSRTPVREAVIRLAEDGLVEIRPRYGVHIRTVPLVELREVYEVLAALESYAVLQVSAHKLKPESEVRLAGHLKAMDLATAASDVEAWFAADQAFHIDLAAECGNVQLGTVVTALRARISRSSAIMTSMQVIPRDSNTEHVAILAAMHRGDARGAHDLLLAHHKRVTAEMLDLLKRRGVLEL